MKKKKSDKKKNDKAQQILNYIIITILTVVCTFSYCQKKRALEVSGFTICKVIKKYRKPVRGFARWYIAVIKYYVSGKRYEYEYRGITLRPNETERSWYVILF